MFLNGKSNSGTIKHDRKAEPFGVAAERRWNEKRARTVPVAITADRYPMPSTWQPTTIRGVVVVELAFQYRSTTLYRRGLAARVAMGAGGGTPGSGSLHPAPRSSMRISRGLLSRRTEWKTCALPLCKSNGIRVGGRWPTPDRTAKGSLPVRRDQAGELRRSTPEGCKDPSERIESWKIIATAVKTGFIKST